MQLSLLVYKTVSSPGLSIKRQSTRQPELQFFVVPKLAHQDGDQSAVCLRSTCPTPLAPGTRHNGGVSDGADRGVTQAALLRGLRPGCTAPEAEKPARRHVAAALHRAGHPQQAPHTLRAKT